MSTELETLLRSTLAGRAATVTSGPRWSGPNVRDGGTPDPGHNRRRWIAVVAAAAVVAGVSSAAVALRDDSHRDEPARPSPSVTAPNPSPSASTSSPSPSASKSAPPSPQVPVTELRACVTALPGAWTDVLQNSVVDLGGRTAMPLAVAPDGSVVALRDDGVTPGSPREVVVAAPGGPPSVAYTVKQPDLTTVSIGAVTGPWLVLGLQHDARPAKNVIPGSSSIGLQGIVVVNLENLSTTLIAGNDSGTTQTDGEPSINSFAVSGSVVYWDERQHYADTTGVLKAYDLGRGTAAGVYTGPIGYVTANAAGVGWLPYGSYTKFFAIKKQLPAVVERSMTPFSRARIQTDGTSYGWIGSPTDVYWWQPGLAAPVHLKLPQSSAIDTDDGHGSVLVSGHLLVDAGPQPKVIDMRTGAVAPLPSNGVFDATHRGELIDNTGSHFYGLAFTGSPGHFESGYWADTAMSVLHVDLAGLPDPSC